MPLSHCQPYPVWRSRTLQVNSSAPFETIKPGVSSRTRIGPKNSAAPLTATVFADKLRAVANRPRKKPDFRRRKARRPFRTCEAMEQLPDLTGRPEIRATPRARPSARLLRTNSRLWLRRDFKGTARNKPPGRLGTRLRLLEGRPGLFDMLVWCLRNTYTFVALKLAWGEARGRECIPSHTRPTEQRSPRPISAQPGGRPVFWAEALWLAPYRSTAGYALVPVRKHLAPGLRPKSIAANV